MKVYFIGAGPGAADLITVRGADILRKADLILYAGSLVSEEILQYCREEATCVNTASLYLEQQLEWYRQAQQKEWMVARIHSGDPAIYGATAEQIHYLREWGVEFEIVPGVSSFTAAAACFGAELTKPSVAQSIILTRTTGRASEVPEREILADFASHQTTLCIFLSGPHLASMVADLQQHYPDDTPIWLIQKATWPQERRHQSTLGTVLDEVKPQEWALSTMILVGEVLREKLPDVSKLYSSEYTHRFRRREKNLTEA
jgi:precorrin-4/cobalt-precorrin-4 C11-methyltransferase